VVPQTKNCGTCTFDGRLSPSWAESSGFAARETEPWGWLTTRWSRFGTLLRAHHLVGFTPERDYQYVEINRTLRRIHADVIAETMAEIERVGGQIR
jgi:hypothetical protein